MRNNEAMRRASEAIRRPAIAIPRSTVPAKASELIKQRHADAVKALERAIDGREKAFAQLVRAHAKVWKVARQLQRYEKIAK